MSNLNLKEQYRKTSQFLIPTEKSSSSTVGEYDIYPTYKLPNDLIFSGFDSLADKLSNEKRIVIDGYAGVFYDWFRDGLNDALSKLGKNVFWQDLSTALKQADEIDSMVEPFLGGNDPLFGKRTDLRLSDFYSPEKLQNIKPDPIYDINIVIGTGAAMVEWDASIVYIDLPKNELQFRSRAEKITNLGAIEPAHAKSMYKRFYFVDWVVLNNHKQEILSRIDVIVDGQHPYEPSWMIGSELRNTLSAISKNVFRVRPWFEPGAWGGTWIKDKIKGLNKDVPNYAWSFELIVPENGLLLQSGAKMLEISFDCLMFMEAKAILGDCHQRFGVEFPIRMDFLDTFDGGNLSVQCHPRTDYMKKHFGEDFTQEETYYILDAREDAEVYLGFKDSIVPKEFEAELENSYKNKTPVQIENYVQKHPAKKHDLFLIPSGSIHASGKNTLVLEISSTPYIFTFKMYDWLRLDLDGEPRPLNIKRGMENLYFERKGNSVKEKMISKAVLLNKGADWEMFHLPTHKEHLYDVHRFHFETVIEVETDNKCHVLSLVEGTSILVKTKDGVTQRFNYAETFVVPAATEKYTITNESKETALLVKAFVK